MRRARALAVVALLLTACSGGAGGRTAQPGASSTTAGAASAPTTAPLATTTTLGYPVFTVATAEVPSVTVYEEPDGAVMTRLRNPNPQYGTPRVFLVKEDRGDWVQALLPQRPNGITGWMKKSDVSLVQHDFRIVVELGAHRLTVYEKNAVFLEAPVGTGRSATPSTLGTFYTTELIEVLPYQQGAYGPYAYGLSAYSEVLNEFAGGDGQMGIHGTGDPTSVGHDVSSGCIRMTNDMITQLAEKLPIGVPVEIRA